MFAGDGIRHRIAFMDRRGEEFDLGFGRLHINLHDRITDGCLLLVVQLHQILRRTSLIGHDSTLLLLFPQNASYDVKASVDGFGRVVGIRKRSQF